MVKIRFGILIRGIILFPIYVIWDFLTLLVTDILPLIGSIAISFPANVIVLAGIAIIVVLYFLSPIATFIFILYMDINKIWNDIQIVPTNWIVGIGFNWAVPVWNNIWEVIDIIVTMVWNAFCNGAEGFAEVADCTGFENFLIILSWMWESIEQTYLVFKFTVAIFFSIIAELRGIDINPRRSPWAFSTHPKFTKDYLAGNPNFVKKSPICSTPFCNTLMGGNFDDFAYDTVINNRRGAGANAKNNDDVRRMVYEEYKEGFIDHQRRSFDIIDEISSERRQAWDAQFDSGIAGAIMHASDGMVYIPRRVATGVMSSISPQDYNSYKRGLTRFDVVFIQVMFRLAVLTIDFVVYIIIPFVMNIVAFVLDCWKLVTVFFINNLIGYSFYVAEIFHNLVYYWFNPLIDALLGPTDPTQINVDPSFWDPNTLNYTDYKNENLGDITQEIIDAGLFNITDLFLYRVPYVERLTPFLIHLRLLFWDILTLVYEVPYVLLVMIDKMTCFILNFPGCLDFEEHICGALFHPPVYCISAVYMNNDVDASILAGEPIYTHTSEQYVRDMYSVIDQIKYGKHNPFEDADLCVRKGYGQLILAPSYVLVGNPYTGIPPNNIQGVWNRDFIDTRPIDWEFGSCLGESDGVGGDNYQLEYKDNQYVNYTGPLLPLSESRCGYNELDQQCTWPYAIVPHQVIDFTMFTPNGVLWQVPQDYLPEYKTSLCGGRYRMETGGGLYPDVNNLDVKFAPWVMDIVDFIFTLIPGVTELIWEEDLFPLFDGLYNICMGFSKGCPCTKAPVSSSQTLLYIVDSLFGNIFGLDLTGVPCNPTHPTDPKCGYTPYRSLFLWFDDGLELIGVDLIDESQLDFVRREPKRYLTNRGDIKGADWIRREKIEYLDYNDIKEIPIDRLSRDVLMIN